MCQCGLRNLRCVRSRLFLAGFALLLAQSFSFGQIVNASLSGTVADSTGAVVPGVRVTASNAATGVVFKTATNDSGIYTFPSLAPGDYNLTFEKEGFSTTVLSGIILQVDQKAALDATLKVGSLTQQVEVRTQVPIISTETATMGTVIDTRQVVDLPLNLREFGSLATLSPGAITDNGGFASNTQGSPFSQTSFNSNGNRSASNNFLIDGVMSKNLSLGGFSLSPPPDAIQEFNLESNIYDASFGMTAGSTINLATKSGSNQIHGAVYDFLRNNDLDARNFFNLNQSNPVTGTETPGSARPVFRRNQFGFALGGPLKKDKTFWFVNYEGLRRTEGGEALNTVPTPTELSGNFSAALTGNTVNLCGGGGPANLNFDSGQIFNPATVYTFTCPAGSALAGSSILAGSPVPGNIITNIDPVAAHTLSLNPFPAANYPTVTNFAQTQPLTEQDNQFIVRLDQNLNDKNQLFARYMFGQSTWNNPYGSEYSTLPSFGSTLYFRGQNVALGWTHTVSPTVLNEVRLGFQRDYDLVNCASCPRAPNFMKDFGIQNLTGYAPDSIGFPIFIFANYSMVGDAEYTPLISPDMLETYSDNITWTHGKHSTRVGASLQFWQVLNDQSLFSPHGQFNYLGQYSGLNGEVAPAIPIGGQPVGVADLADFLQGEPVYANYSLRYLGTNQAGGKFWSFFAQDDWKLKPNLTINLGLRWEYRGFPYDKRNNFVSFVPLGAPFSGPGNEVLISAEPDAVNDAYCRDPQYAFLISATGQCLVANSALRASLGFTGGTRRSLVFPDHKDFDPRLGIAWKPTQSDKLVVRAGFGVFTDLPNLNNQHFATNNPINSTSVVYNAPGGAPPPVINAALVTSENVLAASGTPPLSQQFVSLYIPPNYRDPQIIEWSFGLQSQLAQNWAIETDYVGNKGYYLGFLHYFGNQPRPTPPSAPSYQPYRPYPDFGSTLYTSPNANSNYNSLQVKLTKRFSQGFTFLAGYTWQAVFDDNEGDEGFGGGVGNFGPQDDNCISCSYGPSYDDAHQRFVISGVWELPFGQGKHFGNRRGIVDEVIGGWKASGIYSYQTGFPITILSPVDYSNSLAIDYYADRLCNGNNGPKTVQQWFNTSCFSVNAERAAEQAGTPRYGNQQRNDVFGPPFSDLDLALLKDFALSERFKLQFRAETYNSIDHPSFGYPNTSVGTGTYGMISSTVNPDNMREIQFALKLLF